MLFSLLGQAIALLWFFFDDHKWLPLRSKAKLLLTLLLSFLPAPDPLADELLSTQNTVRVTPNSTSASASKKPRPGVLITGATGLVGVHLIDHLLRTRTGTTIYCLVRKRSVGNKTRGGGNAPSGKLATQASKYGLTLPGFAKRVVILEGDCKDARLGLSDERWAHLAAAVGHVFHLAANSSFIAQYEMLRAVWMPSFCGLLDFCAQHAVAFHWIGSVGRFAVTPRENRTRRGVWTSGYMRLKLLQYNLVCRYQQAGLTGSVVECAYIIGSLASGGVNPGFGDSLWKAAALQQYVGAAFPGDASLVPVDALVAALVLNAFQPAKKRAKYMHLCLKRLMTSQDIGIPASVSPADFVRRAAEKSLSRHFLRAFVPDDIGVLVPLMHRPFEAPPNVRALFDRIDDDAVIRANYEYAKPSFAPGLAKLLGVKQVPPAEEGKKKKTTPVAE